MLNTPKSIDDMGHAISGGKDGSKNFGSNKGHVAGNGNSDGIMNVWASDSGTGDQLVESEKNVMMMMQMMQIMQHGGVVKGTKDVERSPCTTRGIGSSVDCISLGGVQHADGLMGLDDSYMGLDNSGGVATEEPASTAAATWLEDETETPQSTSCSPRASRNIHIATIEFDQHENHQSQHQHDGEIEEEKESSFLARGKDSLMDEGEVSLAASKKSNLITSMTKVTKAVKQDNTSDRANLNVSIRSGKDAVGGNSLDTTLRYGSSISSQPRQQGRRNPKQIQSSSAHPRIIFSSTDTAMPLPPARKNPQVTLPSILCRGRSLIFDEGDTASGYARDASFESARTADEQEHIVEQTESVSQEEETCIGETSFMRRGDVSAQASLRKMHSEASLLRQQESSPSSSVTETSATNSYLCSQHPATPTPTSNKYHLQSQYPAIYEYARTINAAVRLKDETATILGLCAQLSGSVRGDSYAVAETPTLTTGGIDTGGFSGGPDCGGGLSGAGLGTGTGTRECFGSGAVALDERGTVLNANDEFSNGLSNSLGNGLSTGLSTGFSTGLSFLGGPGQPQIDPVGFNPFTQTYPLPSTVSYSPHFQQQASPPQQSAHLTTQAPTYHRQQCHILPPTAISSSSLTFNPVSSPFVSLVHPHNPLTSSLLVQLQQLQQTHAAMQQWLIQQQTNLLQPAASSAAPLSSLQEGVDKRAKLQELHQIQCIQMQQQQQIQELIQHYQQQQYHQQLQLQYLNLRHPAPQSHIPATTSLPLSTSAPTSSLVSALSIMPTMNSLTGLHPFPVSAAAHSNVYPHAFSPVYPLDGNFFSNDNTSHYNNRPTLQHPPSIQQSQNDDQNLNGVQARHKEEQIDWKGDEVCSHHFTSFGQDNDKFAQKELDSAGTETVNDKECYALADEAQKVALTGEVLEAGEYTDIDDKTVLDTNEVAENREITIEKKVKSGKDSITKKPLLLRRVRTSQGLCHASSTSGKSSPTTSLALSPQSSPSTPEAATAKAAQLARSLTATFGALITSTALQRQLDLLQSLSTGDIVDGGDSAETDEVNGSAACFNDEGKDTHRDAGGETFAEDCHDTCGGKAERESTGIQLSPPSRVPKVSPFSSARIVEPDATPSFASATATPPELVGKRMSVLLRQKGQNTGNERCCNNAQTPENSTNGMYTADLVTTGTSLNRGRSASDGLEATISRIADIFKKEVERSKSTRLTIQGQNVEDYRGRDGSSTTPASFSTSARYIPASDIFGRRASVDPHWECHRARAAAAALLLHQQGQGLHNQQGQSPLKELEESQIQQTGENISSEKQISASRFEIQHEKQREVGREGYHQSNHSRTHPFLPLSAISSASLSPAKSVNAATHDFNAWKKSGASFFLSCPPIRPPSQSSPRASKDIGVLGNGKSIQNKNIDFLVEDGCRHFEEASTAITTENSAADINNSVIKQQVESSLSQISSTTPQSALERGTSAPLRWASAFSLASSTDFDYPERVTTPVSQSKVNESADSSFLDEEKIGGVHVCPLNPAVGCYSSSVTFVEPWKDSSKAVGANSEALIGEMKDDVGENCLTTLGMTKGQGVRGLWRNGEAGMNMTIPRDKKISGNPPCGNSSSIGNFATRGVSRSLNNSNIGGPKATLGNAIKCHDVLNLEMIPMPSNRGAHGNMSINQSQSQTNCFYGSHGTFSTQQQQKPQNIQAPKFQQQGHSQDQQHRHKKKAMVDQQSWRVKSPRSIKHYQSGGNNDAESLNRCLNAEVDNPVCNRNKKDSEVGMMFALQDMQEQSKDLQNHAEGYRVENEVVEQVFSDEQKCGASNFDDVGVYSVAGVVKGDKTGISNSGFALSSSAAAFIPSWHSKALSDKSTFHRGTDYLKTPIPISQAASSHPSFTSSCLSSSLLSPSSNRSEENQNAPTPQPQHKSASVLLPFSDPPPSPQNTFVIQSLTPSQREAQISTERLKQLLHIGEGKDERRLREERERRERRKKMFHEESRGNEREGELQNRGWETGLSGPADVDSKAFSKVVDRVSTSTKCTDGGPSTTNKGIGSALHPYDCKPCAFFWGKGCQNGESCRFCHEEHPPKRKKPMKDQKNLMIIARPDGKIEYIRCSLEEALIACDGRGFEALLIDSPPRFPSQPVSSPAQDGLSGEIIRQQHDFSEEQKESEAKAAETLGKNHDIGRASQKLSLPRPPSLVENFQTDRSSECGRKAGEQQFRGVREREDANRAWIEDGVGNQAQRIGPSEEARRENDEVGVIEGESDAEHDSPKTNKKIARGVNVGRDEGGEKIKIVERNEDVEKNGVEKNDGVEKNEGIRTKERPESKERVESEERPATQERIGNRDNVEITVGPKRNVEGAKIEIDMVKCNDMGSDSIAKKTGEEKETAAKNERDDGEDSRQESLGQGNRGMHLGKDARDPGGRGVEEIDGD